MYEHLIFFDGDCPFCHRSVRHIIDIDKDKRFVFAPLQGETAQEILVGPYKTYQNSNSLILIENFRSTDRKIWIESRAVLRIYWLVGGWGIIGIFCFFPGFIGDPIYRWFASHRHQFKLKMPNQPGPKERFLP